MQYFGEVPTPKTWKLLAKNCKSVKMDERFVVGETQVPMQIYSKSKNFPQSSREKTQKVAKIAKFVPNWEKR